MSKKKKNKWKNLPSTCRTSIIGMLIFLIIGICLIVYGAFFGNVERSDIQSVEADIVSVSRVSRNLSPSQEEDMRKKGISEGTYKVFGIIFIILGSLAGAAAYVLRPKNTKKKQKPEA